jgi:hypothetical protein
MKFVQIRVMSFEGMATDHKVERAFVLNIADNRIELLIDTLRTAALSMTGVQFEEVSTSITAPLVKKTD